MSTDVAALRTLIAERLRNQRGLRAQEAFATRLDTTPQRISKYERGFIPDAWIFLARLHDEEGVDLNLLLTSRGNGK